MPPKYRALGLGFAGVIPLVLTLSALRRGSILVQDGVVYHRSSEPLRYYAMVAACAAVAFILFMACVYFFQHPELLPAIEGDGSPD
jgi:hypothetical protein